MTHNRYLSEGHPEGAALRIGDTIATHLNFYVPIADYPTESTFTAIGATCDVMGAYAKRI